MSCGKKGVEYKNKSNQERITNGELEGLNEPDSLFDRTPNGQVIHCDLSEDTLWINDEQPPQRNTFVLQEDAVVTGDCHIPVSNERKVEVRTEAAFLTGLGGPREVRVFRVG